MKEVEELTIHFNSHAVRVAGQALKELLLELQAANVELLREIPEHFDPLTNGVIIRTINVIDLHNHVEMSIESPRSPAPASTAS